MKRLLVDPDQIHGDRIQLTREQAHHLHKVLRLEMGEVLDVTEPGSGQGFKTRLSSMKSGELLVVETTVPVTRTGPVLEMALAWIKGPRVDEVVEALTALDVEALHFFPSERSHRGQDPGTRQERLAKIVRSACEQSGRDRLMELKFHGSLEDLLECISSGSAYLFTAAGGSDLPKGPWSRDRVIGIIGPEGDFTEAELACVRSHGTHPITIAGNVLRSELAAIVAATLLKDRRTGF